MDESMPDPRTREPLVISCDACAMRRTAACGDCVVAYLLDGERADATTGAPLELDVDQARVVRLLSRAGMLPELRYREAV